MTKKSHSRLRRDAFKASNTAWDDLKQIYATNQSKLNTVVTSVNMFFRIDNIAAFIPDGQREFTIQSINGLSSDIKIFQTRLNDIYKMHSAESGMLKLEDETGDKNYVRMLSIGDAYMNFELDYRAILEPLYNQILGIMQTIENRVNAVASMVEEQEQAAQEPQAAPT